MAEARTDSRESASKWRSNRSRPLEVIVHTGSAPADPHTEGAVMAAREQLKLAIGETSDLHAVQRTLVEQVSSLERRLAICMESLSCATPGLDAKETKAGALDLVPRQSSLEVPRARTGDVADPSLRANASGPSDAVACAARSEGGIAAACAPEPIPLPPIPDAFGNDVKAADSNGPLSPKAGVLQIRASKTATHLEDALAKAEASTPLDVFFQLMPDNAMLLKLRETIVWMIQKTIEPERRGFLARLTTSKRFELVCVVVMVFNAFFAAYVSDNEMYHLAELQVNPLHRSDEGALVFFYQVEIALLSFYVVELGMKFVVHGRYLFCNEDWRWNTFDIVLVMFSAVDVLTSALMDDGEGTNVSFMRVLRLLRLSKILRVFRAFRLFTELRLMLNALTHSFVMVFWALFMLMIILFALALVICQGVAQRLDDPDPLPPRMTDLAILHFGSVFKTMLSLYKCMTGGSDWGPSFEILEHVGSFYAIGFLFYTAFFVFSLFNILTGMVVENVVKAASRDDEMRMFNFRMKKQEDCLDLCQLFKELDTDNSGKMNAHELRTGMDSVDVQVIMDKVELDPKDTELFFNMLASLSDDREVDINAFVDGCMHLRGPAAGIDLQALIFETRIMAQNIKSVHKMMLGIPRAQLTLVDADSERIMSRAPPC